MIFDDALDDVHLAEALEYLDAWRQSTHDNPFGQRLTAFLIGKQLPTSCLPMSPLADHLNVQFNYYRGGLGTRAVEMH